MRYLQKNLHSQTLVQDTNIVTITLDTIDCLIKENKEKIQRHYEKIQKNNEKLKSFIME